MSGEGRNAWFGPNHASRVAQLERTLRLGHAGILVLLGAVVASLGNVDAPREHLALAAGLWIVAIDVLRRGPHLAQVAVAAVLTLAAAAPMFAVPADSTAGVVASATTVCVVRTTSGRARFGVLGMLFLGVLGVSLITEARTIYASVEMAATGPVVAYMVAPLARFLERGTARADAAAAAADAEQLTLNRHRSVDQAISQARRVLHDEVLTALSAIVSPSTSRWSTSPSSRALSLRAVEAMRSLTGDEAPRRDRAEQMSELDRALAEMVTASPVEVVLRIEPSAQGRTLSPAVFDAMRRAVAEALRNVARHTSCTEARLVVSAREDTIELAVQDTGGGWQLPASRGVGTTEAIQGAVAAVGGRATISNEAQGCVVHLRLPAPRVPQSAGVLRRAREQTEAAGGPIGELVWPVAGPLVAVQVYIAVRYSFFYERPAAPLTLLAVVLPVSLLYLRVISRGAPRPWTVLAFHAAFVVLAVLSLAISPPDGLIDQRAWLLGFVGNVVFVGVFLLPVTWALPILSLHVAILIVTWRVAPELSDLGLPVSALNAFAFTPLVPALVGALVRRDGRTVLAERTRRLSRLSELELRRQLSRAVSLHLDHTRRVIVPWLARVANGELDPADPAVQARARVLAREARDDLHAAGFFDDRLREEVSRYRAAGGVVEIRPGLRPGSHARVTGSLLRSLVVALPPTHRITVSPTPQDAERARVAVVPPPPAPLPASLPRGARLVEHDQDRLVLTVAEWTEPAEVPEAVVA